MPLAKPFPPEVPALFGPLGPKVHPLVVEKSHKKKYEENDNKMPRSMWTIGNVGVMASSEDALCKYDQDFKTEWVQKYGVDDKRRRVLSFTSAGSDKWKLQVLQTNAYRNGKKTEYSSEWAIYLVKDK